MKSDDFPRIFMRIYNGIDYELVDILHLQPEQISIHGIAHALSRLCRFGGNLDEHYSVAQHSVLVSQLLEKIDPPAALWGLMHDAAEAYLVDLPSPIKRILPQYEKYENKILDDLGLHFRLGKMSRSVKAADRAVCYREQTCLQHVPEFYFPASSLVAPIITPISAIEAEIMFLRQYLKLRRET